MQIVHTDYAFVSARHEHQQGVIAGYCQPQSRKRKKTDKESEQWPHMKRETKTFLAEIWSGNAIKCSTWQKECQHFLPSSERMRGYEYNNLEYLLINNFRFLMHSNFYIFKALKYTTFWTEKMSVQNINKRTKVVLRSAENLSSDILTTCWSSVEVFFSFKDIWVVLWLLLVHF